MASSVLVNPADMFAVLQAMVDFAVANAGFVDEGNATSVSIDYSGTSLNLSPTPSTGTVYRLSKNGIYFHFGHSSTQVVSNSGVNCLGVGAIMGTVLQTAMNGVNNRPTTETPGLYTNTPLFVTTGPFENAYFYTQGNAVHTVLEVSPNVFSHISFGTVDKFGTWSGGEYLTMTKCTGYSGGSGWDNDFSSDITPIFSDAPTTMLSSSYLYTPNSNSQRTNVQDDFTPLYGEQGAHLGSLTKANFCVPYGVNNANEVADTPDTRTYTVNDKTDLFYGFPFISARQVPISRTASFPMLLRGTDATVEDGNSPYDLNDAQSQSPVFLLGQLEGVRLVNMYNASPKDLIDTNWRIFPICQKSGSAFSGPITGEFAIAYLED